MKGQMPLDRGADINARGGYYGNALPAPLKRSHGKVVQMLLDQGADVSAQSGENSACIQTFQENPLLERWTVNTIS